MLPQTICAGPNNSKSLMQPQPSAPRRRIRRASRRDLFSCLQTIHRRIKEMRLFNTVRSLERCRINAGRTACGDRYAVETTIDPNGEPSLVASDRALQAEVQFKPCPCYGGMDDGLGPSSGRCALQGMESVDTTLPGVRVTGGDGHNVTLCSQIIG